MGGIGIKNREKHAVSRKLRLRLEKAWPILDLCGGQGRHALELCRRGFQDVTVLDYSNTLIDLGRKRAQEEGLNALFVQKDARDTALPDEKFRAIIVMASSFGYFVDESQNEMILREAFRLLARQGSLLMDLPSRDHVLTCLSPQSWHEANMDIVVCRERRLEEEIVYGREIVISKTKGLIRDAAYCTRLYSPDRISEMLRSVGFAEVIIHEGFVSSKKRGDYGLMSNRMIAIASKK